MGFPNKGGLESGGTGGGDIIAHEALTAHATTAAVDLYVATTGSDSNPGTVGSPFLTVQAAYDSLPKVIRYPVIITLGVGNFAAALVSNFSFEPATSAGAYIELRGTLVNASPATGTATGTTTTGTAGVITTTAWGTATDSGQSWTTNDLRGKLLSYTSGAYSASGYSRVVSSNTGTVARVAGENPVGATATPYAVQEWGTSITSLATFPATASTASSASFAGIAISGGSTPYGFQSCLVFRNIRFATGGRGILARSNVPFSAFACKFESTTAFSAVDSQTSQYQVNECYFLATSSAGSQCAAAAATVGRSLITRCVFDLQSANARAFSFLNSAFQLYACDIKATTATTLARGSYNTHTESTVNGTVFDAGGTANSVGLLLDGTAAASTIPAGSLVSLSGVEFKNCAGAGVSASGANCAVDFPAAAAGTSYHFDTCGVGIKILKGARASITASLTFNGNVSEITIDGTAVTAAAVVAATGTAASFYGLAVTSPLSGAGSIASPLTLSGLSGTNTGDVTLGAVGAVPNANGASLSGQVLTLQPASATQPGVVTTGAQTLGGAKTLSDTLASGVASGSNATLLTNGQRIKLGSGTDDFMRSDGTSICVGSSNDTYFRTVGTTIGAKSGLPGVWFIGVATAPAFENFSLLLNGTQLIFQAPASNGNFCWRINANSDSILFLEASGKLVFKATDSSGTPGAATINKASGQVSVANGASSVVVTNSLVTSASVVTAVLQDNTDAVQIRSVVPGSGTFTINLTGVTTGARKVGFVVFN